MLDGILDETKISQLAAFAHDHPDCHMSEALKPLTLTKEQLDALAPVLTDSSRCHGVWTIVEGSTRKWYRLSVLRSGDKKGDSGQRRVFEW